MPQGLSSALLAVVAALGALTLQRSHHSRQLQDAVNVNPARQEERLQASLAIQQRLPTLGFENLAADWTFLQFIQYYGDTDARNITGYSLNDDYFELIVDRDPRFYEANLALSTATSLFGRPPRPQRSITRSLPRRPYHPTPSAPTSPIPTVASIKFCS